MVKKKKYKIKIGRLLIVLAVLLLLLWLVFKIVSLPFKLINKSVNGYVAGNTSEIIIYDDTYKKVDTIKRGSEIKVIDKEITDTENNKYYKMDDKKYIRVDNFSKDANDVVKETVKYVRTYLTVYKDSDTSAILSTIDKGEKLDIIGYDKLLEDGTVNKYKIKYKDIEGYVYSKYLVDDEKEALLHYDEEDTYKLHANCSDAYDVGTAENLDFYPVEKPKFKDNVMPDEVRALYLNAAVVTNVDEYIELAKGTGINAFVVDIKDNTSPAYDSPVMKKYSPTNYDEAMNKFDDYKAAIKKLKDNGYYVIGRITLFKDSFLVTDHPEVALIDTSTGKPFLHNGSYWPSAFNRYVWEFNVELAKEAVTEMGFNEIQFDYVRFPDGTYSYEEDGLLDMQNKYHEEKAQALQKLLMYATDEIHAVGAYVSADVFGESAHNYVTGYGQYWAGISNIVDVISAMPYPDHFSKYEYGFDVPVWTVPYDLLMYWGEFVVNRQKSIPTPAVVRTWIQAYDAIKSPRIEYDAEKIQEQIDALRDSGLTGGFMTWNSASSLTKYSEIKSAFGKAS